MTDDVKPPRPSTKRIRASDAAGTREALLAAGMTLLVEDPAHGALSHLKAGTVAARANRTTGAFFHHWQTQEEYTLDLIEYVLDPKNATGFAKVGDIALQGLAQGCGPEEAIRLACAAALPTLRDDPQTAIELLLWKRSVVDKEMRNWVADKYRALDAANSPFFQGLLDLVGVKPKPPYTIETIGSILTGIATGLLIRWSLDDEVYPADLYFNLVMTLAPLLTEPRETDEAPTVLRPPTGTT